MWLACRRGSRGCKGESRTRRARVFARVLRTREKFLRPLRPQAVPDKPARVQGEPLEVGKVQGSVVPHLT